MSWLNRLFVLLLLLGFYSVANAAVNDAEVSSCGIFSESDSDSASEESSEEDEDEDEEPDCD